MRLRSRLALSALRWVYRVEPAAAALLDASSLRELNRTAFDGQAEEWIRRAEDGFYPEEARLLERLRPRPGRALCLASGGGREAFALARAGFSVVGVEQVEAMVAAANAAAARSGLAARFIAGDMTAPPVGEERFDLILLLNIAYAWVPGRPSRVAWLARLRSLVAPDGALVVNVPVRPPGRTERRMFPLLKALARAAGNPHYEVGDRIDAIPSFFRIFPSPDVVAQEARDAGFTRAEICSPARLDHFAILRP